MAAIFIVSMSPLIVYAQTSFIPLPAGTLEGGIPLLSTHPELRATLGALFSV